MRNMEAFKPLKPLKRIDTSQKICSRRFEFVDIRCVYNMRTAMPRVATWILLHIPLVKLDAEDFAGGWTISTLNKDSSGCSVTGRRLSGDYEHSITIREQIETLALLSRQK